MTSQKEQIQALITDIDSVLQKTTPRLPWVVSGEITQQRQVLERVRNYLVAFQRRQIAGEGFGQAGARPDLLAHDIYYQPAASPYPSQAESQQGQQAYEQNELNAQQMLQAIVQEMGLLRSNLMQPLQADLEVLRQQRDTLTQEIRQLEAQRQDFAGQLPGQQQLIGEFLQALMSRLQETLPQQVAQTLRSSDQQALPYANPYASNLALTGSAPSVIATSDAQSQGLGNIQVSQASSDELLIRLDSTLSIVFESLQRNVQAYQESLSQGLDKMHSMGQQGEMMFTALISHLAQQLGRETSSYLQPATMTDQESARSSSPSLEAPTSNPSPAQQSTPTVNPSLFSQPAGAALQSFTLPFPGTEIADRFADDSTAPSTNVPSVDSAIDSWLRSASGAANPPDMDLEIAALNLEGFDLSQLAAQDVNDLLELDATLLDTNLPPQPLLSPTAPIAAAPTQAMSDAVTVEDTADIDAALKLLEQLSSELQEQPSSVADADAQIDRMLSSPSGLVEETSTAGIPDDARDELDEFYESLFGTDAIASATEEALTSSAFSATETESQPVSTSVIEPIVEPKAAAVPPDVQSPDIQPLDIQLPETQSSNIQPISTLPAEVQTQTGTLAEPPTAPSAPSTSTVADPTLGWVPATPLVAPAAELEIPAALLEDELLDGWDLADTEVNLSEPATTPISTDPLSGWDFTAVDDRASLPLEESPLPATDTLAAFGESQFSDANSDVLPLTATPRDRQSEIGQDATNPSEVSLNEISSLADLFDEPAVDTAASAEGQPLESAIVDAPAPMRDQPLASPLANPTGSPAASPTQAVSADLVAGYLTDDRYTPASPDEDLLSLDEPVEALDSELWLDENTLSRLSEDLFSLEEAISEPSPLAYDREPDPSAALLADAAEPSDLSFNEAATLSDWSNALLDDFAVDEAARNDVALNDPALDDVALSEETAMPSSMLPASFPLESELSIAADPPGIFILEGMDDLFANTPVVPPVTPISPPVPPIPVEEPASFTLEGMDDLFADASVSDQTIAAASTPAAEPSFGLEAFTLEGGDELFADAPPASADSMPVTAVPDVEPAFTLEGADELFADMPVLNPTIAPSLMPPAAAEQPLPFTLEGINELFADMPPATATSPTLSMPPVTLPVADDRPVQFEPAAVEPTQSSSVAGFTLEQVSDLFGEVPAETAPIAPSPTLPAESPTLTEPFTLEQVGDLFVEVPSGESTERSTISASPAEAFSLPFTLEQVGDLFIEMPSASVEPSSAPLTLEQVGDLFAETPSKAANPLPDAPVPTAPPETSALEQAFASLMGSFDETLDASPSVADATEAATQAEKKKEMS